MNGKFGGFLSSKLSNNVVMIKIYCKRSTPRERHNNSDRGGPQAAGPIGLVMAVVFNNTLTLFWISWKF